MKTDALLLSAVVSLVAIVSLWMLGSVVTDLLHAITAPLAALP